MHQDVKEILYSQEQLATRIRELGAEISKDYANESVVLVGVLILFLALVTVMVQQVLVWFVF